MSTTCESFAEYTKKAKEAFTIKVADYSILTRKDLSFLQKTFEPEDVLFLSFIRTNKPDLYVGFNNITHDEDGNYDAPFITPADSKDTKSPIAFLHNESTSCFRLKIQEPIEGEALLDQLNFYRWNNVTHYIDCKTITPYPASNPEVFPINIEKFLKDTNWGWFKVESVDLNNPDQLLYSPLYGILSNNTKIRETDELRCKYENSCFVNQAIDFLTLSKHQEKTSNNKIVHYYTSEFWVARPNKEITATSVYMGLHLRDIQLALLGFMGLEAALIEKINKSIDCENAVTYSADPDDLWRIDAVYNDNGSALVEEAKEKTEAKLKFLGKLLGANIKTDYDSELGPNPGVNITVLPSELSDQPKNENFKQCYCPAAYYIMQIALKFYYTANFWPTLEAIKNAYSKEKIESLVDCMHEDESADLEADAQEPDGSGSIGVWCPLTCYNQCECQEAPDKNTKYVMYLISVGNFNAPGVDRHKICGLKVKFTQSNTCLEEKKVYGGYTSWCGPDSNGMSDNYFCLNSDGAYYGPGGDAEVCEAECKEYTCLGEDVTITGVEVLWRVGELICEDKEKQQALIKLKWANDLEPTKKYELLVDTSTLAFAESIEAAEYPMLMTKLQQRGYGYTTAGRTITGIPLIVQPDASGTETFFCDDGSGKLVETYQEDGFVNCVPKDMLDIVPPSEDTKEEDDDDGGGGPSRKTERNRHPKRVPQTMFEWFNEKRNEKFSYNDIKSFELIQTSRGAFYRQPYPLHLKDAYKSPSSSKCNEIDVEFVDPEVCYAADLYCSTCIFVDQEFIRGSDGYMWYIYFRILCDPALRNDISPTSKKYRRIGMFNHKVRIPPDGPSSKDCKDYYDCYSEA